MGSRRRRRCMPSVCGSRLPKVATAAASLVHTLNAGCTDGYSDICDLPVPDAIAIRSSTHRERGGRRETSSHWRPGYRGVRPTIAPAIKGAHTTGPWLSVTGFRAALAFSVRRQLVCGGSTRSLPHGFAERQTGAVTASVTLSRSAPRWGAPARERCDSAICADRGSMRGERMCETRPPYRDGARWASRHACPSGRRGA